MTHFVEVFYGDHCPGSPEARQVVKAFASDRSDVHVAERDVAAYRALARRYGLIATPAVVIDGNHVLYGVPTIAALVSRMEPREPHSQPNR